MLIFGLGHHGGGVQSAAYFAEHGHTVRVTDLRSAQELAPSVQQLSAFDSIRFTLGGHSFEDVQWADIIIKNPAVPNSHPLLQHAQARVTNDIGIYLGESSHRIAAVTGTKGKSTTVSLLSYITMAAGFRTFTGGNIGVNPLAFLQDALLAEKSGQHPFTVLELSSWQIHDLARHPFRQLALAVMTPLYADHLDRYTSIDEYLHDKFLLFSGNPPPQVAVLPFGGNYFEYLQEIEAQHVFWYAAQASLPPGYRGLSWDSGKLHWQDDQHKQDYVAPSTFDTRHLPAVCAALALGIPMDTILQALLDFPGLEHRCQPVAVSSSTVQFINDSAATIPEAVSLCLSPLSSPAHLIAGGSDKQLDPHPMLPALRKAVSISLLAGSFTDKLIGLLNANSIQFSGPFDTMQQAVAHAFSQARPGSAVVLSPGCASFGLFADEFDRGRQFIDCARQITAQQS
ncbi:MAG: UDP-N-acetylmuramoyl-L-alanine--D-glutamate ligase [Spirochaetota bacterium]